MAAHAAMSGDHTPGETACECASRDLQERRFSDRVDSSAGYSVRLRRDRIEYIDGLGTAVIDAEWLPRRGASVHAFTSTMTGDRDRDVTLQNIAKALAAGGWHLKVHE